MARNDVVLLDGIIDQRVQDAFPSNRRDEVFEYLCFEQILKDFDLSKEEIESGWVDGRDDGGIDAFYTFVNGHLLRDPENFGWPRRNVEIQVWVLTCKHHDTFKQAPLNSLHASISELFDFSLDEKQMKGAYSADLLDARALLFAAYKRLSAARPSLSVHYVYASRGEKDELGDNVGARANQVVGLTRSLFSSSECSFEFRGAADLVAMYRRTKKFSIDLPVLEYLSRGQSGYIVLADLSEYKKFVTDDKGGLRRYLFDSNVRDYLGSSQVNEDILESLSNDGGPDFWWLNNGVTILATAATTVGKTLQLEDIQIVNGLQTTESIYNHFQAGGTSTPGRALLVKIIVTTEPIHRDRIIRATNNQNIVETAALRATDKLQRDIEEYLDRHDWYYERRKNYYRNVGKPVARFVTPMYLASGFVALVMKNPHGAGTLRSRFMRLDESYQHIFSDSTPLQVWVAITGIYKRTEELLEVIRPGAGLGERFLSKWRNLLAFLAVSRLFGKFTYSVGELMKFDADLITEDLVKELWAMVMVEMGPSYNVAFAKSALFIEKCCLVAAEHFKIEGVGVIGRQAISSAKPMTASRERKWKERMDKLREDKAFLDSVDTELPPQPWKPGVVGTVAKNLGCEHAEVSVAIALLIEQGRRHAQRHGIVYGKNGEIIARDPTRTP